MTLGAYEHERDALKRARREAGKRDGRIVVEFDSWKQPYPWRVVELGDRELTPETGVQRVNGVTVHAVLFPFGRAQHVEHRREVA